MGLAAWPVEDTMGLRRRLCVLGAEPHSPVELLAIALGADALDDPMALAAEALWERFGSSRRLRAASIAELCEVQGVGPASAARLKAAMALATRRAPDGPPAVLTPDDAAEWLASGLQDREDEWLHALFLDRRHRVLAHRALTRGGPDHTLVDPRQILRIALRQGAHGLILAHNHPSGDPEPSAQDRDVTRRVARAGREVGVALLDHLVFGRSAFVSLAERGELGPWATPKFAAIARDQRSSAAGS
jgi:DNA repair protein RadC